MWNEVNKRKELVSKTLGGSTATLLSRKDILEYAVLRASVQWGKTGAAKITRRLA